MRRRSAMSLVAGFGLGACLALVAPAPAPAAPAGTAAEAKRQKCGTVPGGVALYDIRARGVGCRYARKTARTWRRTLFADQCRDGRFRCRSRGYRCRAKPPAEVHYKVRCRKGEKRVTWWIHAD